MDYCHYRYYDDNRDQGNKRNSQDQGVVSGNSFEHLQLFFRDKIMYILLGIVVLVFAMVMLLAMGMFYWLDYRVKRSKMLERIKSKGRDLEAKASGKTPFQLSAIKKDLLSIFSSLGKRVKPKREEELSRVRKKLVMAGYRKESGPVVFFGLKAFLGILLPVIFLAVKLLTIKISPAQTLLLLVIMALVGFYLPNIWLRIKINRRSMKILEGFPDAVDLMVVCVESGLGLDEAINRVAQEIGFENKELSEEFGLLILELRAGKTRSDALKNLAFRTDLEDINNLVTLLVQTDKFGTSIGQALRVHADFMRFKRNQRAEEIAAKIPVKILFPVIFFIFPALFTVLLAPSAIRIYRLFTHTQ
jgi:tight adherence protein C